jgi:hypothetical protein
MVEEITEVRFGSRTFDHAPPQEKYLRSTSVSVLWCRNSPEQYAIMNYGAVRPCHGAV